MPLIHCVSYRTKKKTSLKKYCGTRKKTTTKFIIRYTISLFQNQASSEFQLKFTFKLRGAKLVLKNKSHSCLCFSRCVVQKLSEFILVVYLTRRPRCGGAFYLETRDAGKLFTFAPAMRVNISTNLALERQDTTQVPFNLMPFKLQPTELSLESGEVVGCHGELDAIF